MAGNTTLSIEVAPPMGIEVPLKNSAEPPAAIHWEIVKQMLAKIRRWEETELSLEHVPAKVDWVDNKQVSATGPPLAAQEIREQVVLSAGVAGTALEISECPQARVAPGEAGSVALRAGVRREPAANVAPPAWVHAAVAVEAVAVAEGGKQP